MITAKEATRDSILHSKLKEKMRMIDTKIREAVEIGAFDTYIDLGNSCNQDMVDCIISKLSELGYGVTFKPAEPIPVGCPVDQWYSADTLCISWPDK